MAKTAVLVGIISMIMMQSVSGAPKINYNQDHVENETEKPAEQALRSAKLKVKGYAMNLKDLDGWTAGTSDPYMEVTAYDVDGYKETKTTPVDGGTTNPRWDDYLVFSKRTWNRMAIEIMDYDGAGREPDPLCPIISITIDNYFEGTKEASFWSYCYGVGRHAVITYELEVQSIHFADHATTLKTVVYVDSLNYTDSYNLDTVQTYYSIGQLASLRFIGHVLCNQCNV